MSWDSNYPQNSPRQHRNWRILHPHRNSRPAQTTAYNLETPSMSTSQAARSRLKWCVGHININGYHWMRWVDAINGNPFHYFLYLLTAAAIVYSDFEFIAPNKTNRNGERFYNKQRILLFLRSWFAFVVKRDVDVIRQPENNHFMVKYQRFLLFALERAQIFWPRTFPTKICHNIYENEFNIQKSRSSSCEAPVADGLWSCGPWPTLAPSSTFKQVSLTNVWNMLLAFEFSFSPTGYRESRLIFPWNKK